jgi:tripeptide aminopeptidase
MTLLDRFIRYVKIDTQSDGHSSSIPSTLKQLNLIQLLKKELTDLGITRIVEDGKGNLYATIDRNVADTTLPSIGLMAHVDTASEMSGNNVRPQVISNYDSQRITLNKDLNIYLDPVIFPELMLHQSKTLVTTDGTTLLGADDKAGVAIIMTFVAYVMSHPDFKHGPIQIAFTCDEEIGRGVTYFDPKLFQADFAYTLDGGPIEEINIENFNASSALVTIKGASIHPGTAKGQMINAQTIASEFHLALPVDQRPETTDAYLGFIHLTESNGGVESSTLRYIIRDHDLSLLREKETNMRALAKKINHRYQKDLITISFSDSYYNMRPLIEEKPEGFLRAKKAFDALGLTFKTVPIRGGTDGAMLTFKGVPTPNLPTGGYNYHGKYEYLVVEDAEKMVEVLQEIIRAL